MNIDPNKIIAPFSDCRGTCKTPIGCSCGKTKNANSSEKEDIVVMQQKIVATTNSAVETKNISVLQKQQNNKTKICSCGRSDSGFCNCRGKKANSDGTVACCSGTNKLEVYDWLQNMPDIMTESKLIEVQFKNTRKEYYVNSNDLELFKGDIVAVEASPGHDIGEVTLTGKLVELQIRKINYRAEIRRVYRIAKGNDLEKYELAKAREYETMLRAREIAENLRLEMKISDVEFQGDGNKAIFYYIADGRVDFRELIKHYASEFRVKIEMKQIGARQEAGRVGGIGPCGRELCCSSSMSNFVSVSTSAARLQDIPLNPQKLAGQCGKLKCCLNFEVDTYVEAQKKLPSRDIVLETKDSTFFHFKTDILSGMMTYSTDKYFAANLATLPRERVFDVIRLNKRGEKPLTLIDHDLTAVEDNKSHDVLEQESITRFDERNTRNENRRNRRRSRPNRAKGNQRPQTQNNDNTENKNSRTKNRQKKVLKVRQNNNTTTNTEVQKEEQQTNNKRNNRRRNNNRNRGRQHRNKQSQNQQVKNSSSDKKSEN